MNLGDWLAKLGVTLSEDVKLCCKDEKVDADAIQGLSDEQLKQLGFKMGERSKILQFTKPRSMSCLLFF